jgi:hypothetical protein
LGSLGKGMPMFTVNGLVIGKQPENPENPLFYIIGGIPNPEEPEVAAWEQVTNDKQREVVELCPAKGVWQFKVDDARVKLKSLYPCL